MRLALLAQCMYAPWIEWIKNNSLLLAKELNQKLDLEIISHKPHQYTDDPSLKDLKINYLLNLSDNTYLQLRYFLAWAVRTLLFAYKKKITLFSIQYLETSFLCPLLFLILFKWNTQFVLTLYSTDELKIPYKRRFLQCFKYKFKKVIIISEYLREEVKKIWFKDSEIEYIPLSYDKSRYSLLADFEKRDKKTILFSAWIIKEAGSFFMVDLAEAMPEYKFIFALRQFNKKSEDELKILTEYISRKQAKNIEIRRNIYNMDELLWSVGCLILPLQDIHIKMLIPVALLEAMARWTICFVSDLPNLKLLVQDRENAIIFKKDNIYNLREKIEEYICNKSISLEAYQFWRDFPNYHSIGQKYFNIIQALQW